MTSPVSRRGRARADPLASRGERRGNGRTRRRTPPRATLGAVATAAAGGSPVPRVRSPTMRRARGRGGRTRRAARRASRRDLGATPATVPAPLLATPTASCRSVSARYPLSRSPGSGGRSSSSQSGSLPWSRASTLRRTTSGSTMSARTARRAGESAQPQASELTDVQNEGTRRRKTHRRRGPGRTAPQFSPGRPGVDDDVHASLAGDRGGAFVSRFPLSSLAPVPSLAPRGEVSRMMTLLPF